MKLPDAAHLAQPWRIHALTPDFRLEDVWALPTQGAAGDFPRLVELIAAGDPSRGRLRDRPRAVRDPLEARRAVRLGRPGRRASPRCATACPPGSKAARSSARSRSARSTCTDDEWAGEIANRTMHGVMHLGWVPDGAGGYRGQMAVLVKPNGRLGEAYMAAIRPFRHRLVYPPMLRELGRRWRAA